MVVGRDPNDQYFPLAVAVVEGENKDSWTWFLTKLLCNIGSLVEKRWVFISDQQKVSMFSIDLHNVISIITKFVVVLAGINAGI